MIEAHGFDQLPGGQHIPATAVMLDGWKFTVNSYSITWRKKD